MKRAASSVLIGLLLVGIAPAGVLAATAPKFDQQPGGGAPGVVWSQQPVVAIKTGNNVDTSATGSITLSITPGTGTAGAALICATSTTTVQLTSGSATFGGCSINLAGTGYRLRATWSGGGTVDSSTFNITSGTGAATKLGFTTQPARGTPNGAFAVQPVVALQNASGATVTSAPAATVTLALGANPGGGVLTCSGGNSKTTLNGVATFSGCLINVVGVGYTLVATSSPLTSATSAAFDVSDRVVFTTQPAGAAGGIAFTTQPVVAVRAGASATATHDSGTVVTLSIKAGTGATGAILTCSGGVSKTVVAGVAAFTGCALDKASPTSPANPYVLVATASGLTSAESAALTVGSGTATKLVFRAQPGTSTATQPFGTQPVVAITDAGGNTVTTGTAATRTVTLSIGTNPGGGVLTCTGGLSKVAVAGVATFAGCAISRPGNGYTLVAASSGLTSATSSPFNVTSGANLILTTSASVITWGNGVSISARIDQLGANRVIQFQGSKNLATWTTITTLTTNSLGTTSFTYRPATNLYYRAVFAGATDLGALTSSTARVVVRQISILRPTNFGAVKRISRGSAITFVDTVRPSRPELTPATVRFVFYRRSSTGVWVLSGLRDVPINSLGLASTRWTFTVGEWYVRSQARPTPNNANSVWGQVERYSVR
jgi:hypothetical protein